MKSKVQHLSYITNNQQQEIEKIILSLLPENRMRKILPVILFVLAVNTYAQQFGANDPSLQWKETATDTVNVIYTKGMDSIAARIASLAAYQQKHFSHTIGDKIEPVNVVIQNQVNNSNGYVSMAPYRSEFYLTPPIDAFDMGVLKWEDMLTLHEFRHVQQYSNFNNGITKAISFVFGEGGRALANAMAVPNWFFEGDAVHTETILSTQGRGKIPLFHNGFKALHNENKQYSYMKLRNGSYKHYVPNHYQLGYLFTAYGYEKYGDDFWRNVTRRASAFKPLLYPFQKNIKKYSDVNFKEFINNSFDYYKVQWNADQSDSLTFISPLYKNNVTDYKYVYPAKENTFVTLKKSYRQIPAFYWWNNNVLNKIAVKHINKDDYFSYNNDKIVYAVHTPDNRWRHHEYSDIQLLDVKTKKQKKLTNRQRYYTPDISRDGDKIVMSEILPNQQSSLVILDSNGEVIKKHAAAGRNIYTYPKFIKEENIIVLERNEAGKMSLQMIDLSTAHKKTLLPFSNVLLGYPVVVNDTVYYTRSAGQYDEAMAYILSDNKHYKLATYTTGIYQSFVHDDHLYGSVFTAEGYRLAKFSPKWAEWEIEKDSLRLLYNPNPQNAAYQTLQGFEAKSIAAKPYKKTRGLLNFHSMQPYFSDPDYTLSFLSENILNTFLLEAGYTFNRIEKFHKGMLSMRYGGWYLQPFMNVSGVYKREMQTFYASDSTYRRLTWNELNTAAGIQLPLNFTSGRMYKNLMFSSSVHNNNVFYTDSPTDAANKNILYFQNRLSYTQQSQRAMQQIHPRWAQSISLTYRNGIDRFKSYQFSASGNFYFPGLLSTHSMVINGAFQNSDTLNNYVFSSIFPFSRGYNAINFQKMYKAGANYHFPVMYPDIGVANIVFLKRIRANIFYDHTLAFNRANRQYTYASTGAELFFDTGWWNQLPVSFGMRYSRLLNTGFAPAARNRWELILPVNLYGN